MNERRERLQRSKLETNPVASVREGLLAIRAGGFHRYGERAQRWLNRLAGTPGFVVPVEFRDEIASWGFNVNGMACGIRPAGVVGLVVDGYGRGLVHPIQVRFVRVANVDRHLPFDVAGLRQTLGVLLRPLGGDTARVVDSIQFEIANSLEGIEHRGQSMHVAAALAVLNQRADPTHRLSRVCATVEIANNEVSFVDNACEKLDAFVREYQRGSVLIRYLHDRQSARFDRFFDDVWAVDSVESLCDHLRTSGLTRWVERAVSLAARRAADTPGGSFVPVVDCNCWRQLLEDDAREATEDLAALGSEVSGDSDAWAKYLSCVQQHIDSGSLVPNLLEKQLGWLRRYAPGGAYARLALLQAALELAQRNHRGDYDATENQQLRSRCNEFAEDPRLVTWIRLHLCVAETNRFDFAAARRELGPSIENAPILLSLKGRHLSSLGQCAAFEHRLKDARDLFARALELFRKLSNPRQQQRECSQTGFYHVLATMDDDAVADDDARTQLCGLLQAGSLAEASAHLCVSRSPVDVYAHHALVRFLALRGSSREVADYLSMGDDWDRRSGEHHPWECIQFYRAWMLRQTGDEDWSYWLSQSLAALKGADTMAVIGASFATVGVGWGQPWSEGLQWLDAFSERAPHLSARVAELRAALHGPRPARQLLDAVVPFYFH